MCHDEDVPLDAEGLCEPCRTASDDDNRRIEALAASGHTEHCSARQVWGDGECECKGGDRG